ncbi:MULTISPECIES: iron chelate uptake ABC transporter family permease subunit [Bacillus]|jgi:iron complex transport system permease protein|uniref:Iron compound ABC transporter, permease protein n=2 Tax=Bacillus cereus group TaxID=86661 RepID=Q72XZ9_BACC1|nr:MULTISPECIES: iron chelate uptake ABC transporter family permease subunit [Bacillus]AAS44125.1 iron compound ABC transporter, permease protein [Bacillus cereus ATCC 10987]KMQ29377.1 iron ABC transporter permease [Bacillus cereus]KXY78417.1 iron ABC transporter permease [Bacillus cereus]KYQ04600.1 Petrobactin ABC transporter permease protein II [Bacillus cereus]MCC2351050.1 iron chelate uptake ABC transporter family permease subunit [Bacillus pacificus]
MITLDYRNKENVEVDSSLHNESRSASAFRSKKEARRYWIVLITLIALGLLSSYGLLVYNNPVPIDSPSFIPVVKRRIVAIVAMIIAAVCHSLSTVAFQSITNNKIITPSLLGFESLYSAIHTSTIFFFGASALINFTGIGPFLFQIFVMVLMSLILYGWLLSGKYGNLQLMLLVGIIIGAGLNSMSTFMRKLLAPSEFDLLQAKLFGSVNHADPAYFPIVIPMIIIVAVLIFAHSKNLNVLSLGKDVATSFGVKYQPSVIYTLVLVAILMSISTALIGPLTFYGFLVATLSYQAAATYDHRYIFPMAFAIGFLIMTSAYFLMYHVFNAQGVVSVIIELFGGIIFLTIVLRKRAL